MDKENNRKIDFYLDVFEFLNKPRRIFMGLEMQIDELGKDYTDEEKDLVRRITKEAKEDFYKITLPKFEKEIREIYEK